MKQLTPYGKSKQKEEELQWITQKEKTCDQYNKLDVNSLSFIECQIEQTQQQISVLEFELGE